MWKKLSRVFLPRLESEEPQGKVPKMPSADNFGLWNPAERRRTESQKDTIDTTDQEFSPSSSNDCKNLKVDKISQKGNVALVSQNRPKTPATLSAQWLTEKSQALEELDDDESGGAVVMTDIDGIFSTGKEVNEAASNLNVSFIFPATFRTTEFLHVQRKSENAGISIITLYMPKDLNALSANLAMDLGSTMKELNDDDSCRVIVISVKCAVVGDEETTNAFYNYNDFKNKVVDLWSLFSKMKKPKIASIQGSVLGGMLEIAMMCDIMYASDEAKLGSPEIKMGMTFGVAGTKFLMRTVGKSLAMEMVLTGNQITAQEAKDSGLVSKIFPADQLVPEAVKLAEKISLNLALV